MGSPAPHRVLLGVTGGIAAYKSAELVRRLRDRDVDVQVVMTDGAREFVTPMTFQALSGRPVRSELWDAAAEAAMGHIELARWPDRILIAPASADFLARLAHGLADDLLDDAVSGDRSTHRGGTGDEPADVGERGDTGQHRAARELAACACSDRPKATRPAAKSAPAACSSRSISSRRSCCCAPGDGALAGRKVLITAGPTRERIDPVRFITNRSSGKMGFAVAQAARDAGAEVVIVSGPVNVATPRGVRRVDVETAEQMMSAVNANLAGTDIFIAAAAVSDYRPLQVAAEKIKKTSDSLVLPLSRTTDILASVSAGTPRPFVVGFAAETQNVERNALAKLEGKNLDLIAANQVGENLGFDQDDNALTVYWKGGKRELLLCSKSRSRGQLVALIAEHYARRDPRRIAPSLAAGHGLAR